jgi:hypothetical protein
MFATGRVDDGDASDDDDVDLKTLAMRTARNADNERRAGDADAGSDDGNGDGDGEADETKRYAHHISANTRALARPRAVDDRLRRHRRPRRARLEIFFWVTKKLTRTPSGKCENPPLRHASPPPT